MAGRKKPQMSFDERVVEDPELEEAIETRLENAEAHKAWKDATAEMKRLALETHGLKPGEALRVGEYVLEGRARSGGGGQMRKWDGTSVVVRADSLG